MREKRLTEARREPAEMELRIRLGDESFENATCCSLQRPRLPSSRAAVLCPVYDHPNVSL
jgi:hypothetical protein